MDWLVDLTEQVARMGPWAPVVFLGVYVVATVVLVPASILCMAGGVLFGVWEGTALVYVGFVIGSGISFGLARGTAHDRVNRWLARDPRLDAVSSAVSSRWVVFLMRLSPVCPTNVLNYAMGLSRVSYREFLVGSVGILPAIWLYVYWGRVAGDLALLAAGAGPARGVGYYTMLAVGLAATVGVTVLITRGARRAIDAARVQGELARPRDAA